MHHREIPQFAAIPAVVYPGPLGEGERRVWQLVENLAREDLQPAALAAALLYERCAVLVSKLLDAGVAVPAQVHLDDPVLRWEALERLRVRSGCHQLGAPWEEVRRRLGIQMRAERAEEAHVAANKAGRAALSPLPRRTPRQRPARGRPRPRGAARPARRPALGADSRLRTTPGPFGCSPRSCWPWCSHRPPPDERRDG